MRAHALSLRAAALAGMVTPPLAAAALLLAGWLSPGYDPVRWTVSHLAQPGAPHAGMVDLTLAALGLSVLAVSWALGRRLTVPAGAGVAVLALAGASLLGVAVIRRDPSHPAVLAAHHVAAAALFVSLTLAPLLLGRGLRRDPAWRGIAAVSLVTAAISLALLAAGMLVVTDVLPAGLWERAYVGVDLLWLTLVAARLYLAPASATGRK